MSGTRAGAKKATKTIYIKHGLDFFKRVGAIGGANGHTGGFGSDIRGSDGLTGRERARIAGMKGGRKSSRKGVKNGRI